MNQQLLGILNRCLSIQTLENLEGNLGEHDGPEDDVLGYLLDELAMIDENLFEALANLG